MKLERKNRERSRVRETGDEKKIEPGITLHNLAPPGHMYRAPIGRGNEVEGGRGDSEGRRRFFPPRGGRRVGRRERERMEGR